MVPKASPARGTNRCRLRRVGSLLWLRRSFVCAVLARSCTNLAFVSAPSTRTSSAPAACGVAAGGSRHAHFPDRASLRRCTGSAASPSPAEPDRSPLVQAWGTFGVVAYLSFGVLKVVPIVQEGLAAIEAPWEWGLLAVTLLFFAYVEGYRGFQLGFSPRVVSRAWVVSEDADEAPFWHKALAPAFCIGYFHGTFKRVATSWGVTTVIFAVVIGVKQLPNPYRAIIDAGVIVGLVWGIVSIIVLYTQSLVDKRPPDFDPALPEDTPYQVPQSATAVAAQTAQASSAR